MSYLERIFRTTEDENRRVILTAMPQRPGAALLDLGCARGDWTMDVARHVGAAEVQGVEFIDEWADEATGRGVAVTIANLNERWPFDDATFDVIHSNQVIEHLSGTDRFMSEIHRVLRPGGYAVISTNNLASWHNVASLVMGWQPTPANVSDLALIGNPMNPYEGTRMLDVEGAVPGQTHLRVFTGTALSALATLHGLQVEVELAAGYYPFPVGVARVLARVDRRHGAFLVHRFAKPAAA